MSNLSRIIERLYPIPSNYNDYDGKLYAKYFLKYFVKTIAKHKTTDMFIKVEFEMNANCNRKCHYCPNSKFSREKKKMPMDIIYKLIEDLKRIDYCSIVSPHFYGEPLLDNRLIDIVRLLKSQLPRIDVLLYTNGDLLNLETYKDLSTAGVDIFCVTSHEGKKPFMFLDWYNDNYPNITFRQMDFHSKLANRAGLVNIKNYTPITKCILSTSNLTVDVDGNILYCVNDYFSNYIMGNLKNEFLMDIWNKPNYKDLRKHTRMGQKNLQLCKDCNP